MLLISVHEGGGVQKYPKNCPRGLWIVPSFDLHFKGDRKWGNMTRGYEKKIPTICDIQLCGWHVKVSLVKFFYGSYCLRVTIHYLYFM